jgi:hypothetical protein
MTSTDVNELADRIALLLPADVLADRETLRSALLQLVYRLQPEPIAAAKRVYYSKALAR